ncbi:MAG: hypothetical protein ACAI44_17620 [Candidatus Sericytochromatia bacterium]
MDRVSSTFNSLSSGFQSQIYRRQPGSGQNGGSGSGSGNRQNGQRGQKEQGEPEAESRLIFIDVFERSSARDPSVAQPAPRPVEQAPPQLPHMISGRFMPGYVPSQMEDPLPAQTRQRRNNALALSSEPPQSPEQAGSQGSKQALSGNLPGALNQMSMQDFPKSLRITKSSPSPVAKIREGTVTEAEIVRIQALLASEQVDFQTKNALISKILKTLPEQTDRLLGPLLHSGDARICLAVASNLMAIEGLINQRLATDIVCDFAKGPVAPDNEAAMVLKLQAIKQLGNRLFANSTDGLSSQQLGALKEVLHNRKETPAVRRTVALGMMLLIRSNIKGWDTKTLINEFSHIILDRSQAPQTRYDVLAALALVDPQAPALKQIAATPDEIPKLIALAREKITKKASQ